MISWRSTSLTHLWTGWQGDFAPPPPPPPPPPPGKQHSTCSALQNHTSVSGAQVSRAIVAGDMGNMGLHSSKECQQRSCGQVVNTHSNKERCGISLEQCCAMCDADPKCNAFTLDPHGKPPRSLDPTSALACQIYRLSVLSLFLDTSALCARRCCRGGLQPTYRQVSACGSELGRDVCRQDLLLDLRQLQGTPPRLFDVRQQG